METAQFCLYVALLAFLIGSMALHHYQGVRLVRDSQKEAEETAKCLMQVMVMTTVMQHDLRRIADKVVGQEPHGTCIKKSWTIVRENKTETEAADDVEEGEAQA